MRINDEDLLLSASNKTIVPKNDLSEIDEGYMHMSKNCSMYTIDGVTVPLQLEDISILRNDDYLQKVHIVKAEEVNRLDTISYKYYNNPELWWIIASINNIDPLALYEGQELIIPNADSVTFMAMIKNNR